MTIHGLSDNKTIWCGGITQPFDGGSSDVNLVTCLKCLRTALTYSCKKCKERKKNA
jgi:hypothetical protein